MSGPQRQSAMNTGATAQRIGTGNVRQAAVEPVALAVGDVRSLAPNPALSLSAPGTPLIPVRGTNRDRAGWVAALGAATLAHVGLLLALAWAPPILQAGAGGNDIEASSVEVTLLPAIAFESLRAAREMPASAASLETRAGQPIIAPAAQPVAQPAVAEHVAWTEPGEATKSAQPHVPPPHPRDDAAPSVDTAAPAPAGGNVSRSASVEPSAAAATVIASAGQVAAYASTIAQALGRTRPPKQAPDRGTVRVVFAVGEDGALADIQIKATSGRPSLDALAVVAVRQTRFPPPPPGMTPSQRTYEVPYHFR